MALTIKKTIPALLILNAALALASAGCASKNPDAAAAGASDGAVDAGLSPTSPNITYAKGWNELDIDANSAKNTVDTAGHFHTDHNMCQQAGDGVYSVDAWNSLSSMLNQVVLSNPLPTPRCWDSPNGSKFYNHGVAALVLASGKRQLYEYKNAQICTTIADPAVADALMAAIESTLLLDDQADAQSCPNYHPPGH